MDPHWMVGTGKWLAAYRSGKWRQVPGAPSQTPGLGSWVEWTSPRFGLCRGQILHISAEGWALMGGEHVPRGLAWVHEDLIHR